MRHDPRKLLYDIVTACEAIREFTRDRSAEQYEADRMLRSACERQFEIIGEAMTRLRATHASLFASVENGEAIVAFRHRLIHGYDTVDAEIVWDVIQTKLPHLEQAAKRLIAENK